MLTDSAFWTEIISNCHFPRNQQVGQDRASAIFLHQQELASEAFISHAVMAKLTATMETGIIRLVTHSSSIQGLNKVDPVILRRSV